MTKRQKPKITITIGSDLPDHLSIRYRNHSGRLLIGSIDPAIAFPAIAAALADFMGWEIHDSEGERLDPDSYATTEVIDVSQMALEPRSAIEIVSHDQT